MTTVRDILTDALLQIGVLDPSEAIQPEAASAALRELNRMIASWNAEDLMVYTVDREVYPLIIGKQFYTIGTGGDFNAPRPVVIDMASVLISGSTVELPIEIYNDEQWRDTTVKQVNSSFPLVMWANGNYPLNTLAFWPIPQGDCSLVLYAWGQTSAFSDVNATVSFPQGYEDALVQNLAVRLAPVYGAQPNPVTVQQSAATKARIKRINWEPVYRSADSVLLGTRTDIGQKSRGYVID